MVTEISTYKKSKVVVGESLANLGKYIPSNTHQVVLITDVNVRSIYGDDFLDYPVITIQTGEKIKTQDTIDFIVDKLIGLGADRHTFIVGIGGGIVCDITGYVASIYMRGLSFGYVPSTLLSQVDASIGGKTGINYRGFKNMIGVFSQPKFVLCDINLLTTLPLQEIKSGLAEIVKHAIIKDAVKFDFIVNNLEKILAYDIPTLEHLVKESIHIKTDIVNLDEREKGERKKLNLGHTIGHAIESISGIPHGYAVAIGIVMTAKISKQFGFCSEETVSKVIDIFEKCQMETSTQLDTDQLINTILKDKKKKMNKIDFIVIKNIGDVFIKPTFILELEKNIDSIK